MNNFVINRGGIFKATVTDTVVISNDETLSIFQVDVTKDIMAYLDGVPNYGWVIMKSDEDSSGRINIVARETHANIPQLELTFT